MTGTVLNATAVLIGAGVGLTWRGQPSAANQQAWKILLGAFAVYVGLSTTWQGLNGPWLNGLKELLVVILALTLGNVTGRILRLQEALNQVGQYAQRRLSASHRSASARFNDGFVACSILFCLSPIAVVGALQDGLASNWQTLAVKAVMDGLAALSFARTLGWGVLTTIVPIVAWQGTITLGARALQPWLESRALLDPVLATSGMIVFSIALVILSLKKVRLADYLPSLGFAPLLSWWLS